LSNSHFSIYISNERSLFDYIFKQKEDIAQPEASVSCTSCNK